MRLWIEASHETGLRARITRSLDSLRGEEITAAASTADGICEIVKEWVDDFTELDRLDPQATP